MKPANPRVLCIVGSGVQARGHAEALQVVCQFEEVILVHVIVNMKSLTLLINYTCYYLMYWCMFQA